MPFTFKLSQRLARMRLGVVLLSTAALAACEKPLSVFVGPKSPAPVASVAIAPSSLNLTVGDIQQLSAVLKDSSGNVLTGRSVTWTSSSLTVATVSGSGLTTAMAPGTATLTAASEGRSGTASAGVSNAPVVSVAVSPATASVTVGQTVQLTATPQGATGKPLTGRVVTWASTAPAVATVTGSGLTTGVAAGTATITATSEGKGGTAAMTVSNVPVASVAVSPATASVTVGQTVQLTATPKDASGNPLTGRVVTWASTAPAVATVTGSGLVTGVAAGTVTITATSEGQSGMAAITASNVPVASVTVSPATASVTVAQTVQLTATPKDASGNPLTGRVVTWASTAPAVATVTGGGLVTGVAAGTATITATSEGQSGTAAITASNVPVASVTVSPATASVTVGQTVQLTATPKDASGNPLSGRAVTWATSAAAVATVTGSGLVTGVAAGTATITATSEGKSGTATLTVTVLVNGPGAVTDLAVTGVTASSVTLAFTEVSDGTGQPASYDIRSAPGTLAWGAATDVAQGTCTVPLAGTSIGAKRTCTVLGLAAATGYQFQLVAFRGTLGVNAVFGALSNVASGTTAVSTAPVASVTVSPGSASLTVGAAQQFAAILKDAGGNVLTGGTVSWSSSNTAVATVSGSGLATGVTVGTATVSATSGGVSGGAALTVNPNPAPGTAWPNEPAGFTTVTDYHLGTDATAATYNPLPIGTSGWIVQWNPVGNGTVAVDPTAPVPSAVYQVMYPSGWIDGSAPSTLNSPMFNNAQVYVGWWWKPSNPWQTDPSGTNKIAFLWAGNVEMFISMHWFGSYYALEVGQEMRNAGAGNYDPNITTTPITLGQWHRIEWYANATSGAMEVWLDGVLQTRVTPGFPGAFTMFQLSPTWGGCCGNTKSETDYYWYNYAHVSVQ